MGIIYAGLQPRRFHLRLFPSGPCGESSRAGGGIPELIIIGSMFRKKLVFAFAVNIFFVAIAAGFLVEWLVY